MENSLPSIINKLSTKLLDSKLKKKLIINFTTKSVNLVMRGNQILNPGKNSIETDLTQPIILGTISELFTFIISYSYLMKANIPLNEYIETYARELDIIYNTFSMKKLTFKSLIYHLSGFGDFKNSRDVLRRCPSLNNNKSVIYPLKSYYSNRIVQTFNNIHSYYRSGQNYSLLAYLIQLISKKNFEKLSNDFFHNELNLERTYFLTKRDAFHSKDLNFQLYPSQNLISNLNDLTKFFRVLLDGFYNEKNILYNIINELTRNIHNVRKNLDGVSGPFIVRNCKPNLFEIESIGYSHYSKIILIPEKQIILFLYLPDRISIKDVFYLNHFINELLKVNKISINTDTTPIVSNIPISNFEGNFRYENITELLPKYLPNFGSQLKIKTKKEHLFLQSTFLNGKIAIKRRNIELKFLGMDKNDFIFGFYDNLSFKKIVFSNSLGQGYIFTDIDGPHVLFKTKSNTVRSISTQLKYNIKFNYIIPLFKDTPFIYKAVFLAIGKKLVEIIKDLNSRYKLNTKMKNLMDTIKKAHLDLIILNFINSMKSVFQKLNHLIGYEFTKFFSLMKFNLIKINNKIKSLDPRGFGRISNYIEKLINNYRNQQLKNRRYYSEFPNKHPIHKLILNLHNFTNRRTG